MLVWLNKRTRAHLVAALWLLEAHADDGYAEEHNFRNLDPDDLMSSAEIEALVMKLEHLPKRA